MTRTCEYCGQQYDSQFAGLTKQVFIRKDLVNLHYCTRDCMEADYMQRLRREKRP